MSNSLSSHLLSCSHELSDLDGERGIKRLIDYIRRINDTDGKRYIHISYLLKDYGDAVLIKIKMPAGAARDVALRADWKDLIGTVIGESNVRSTSLVLSDVVIDGLARCLTHWQLAFECMLEKDFVRFVKSIQALGKHLYYAGSYQATILGKGSLKPQALCVINHVAKFAFDAMRRGVCLSASSMEALEDLHWQRTRRITATMRRRKDPVATQAMLKLLLIKLEDMRESSEEIPSRATLEVWKRTQGPGYRRLHRAMVDLASELEESSSESSSSEAPSEGEARE